MRSATREWDEQRRSWSGSRLAWARSKARAKTNGATFGAWAACATAPALQQLLHHLCSLYRVWDWAVATGGGKGTCCDGKEGQNWGQSWGVCPSSVFNFLSIFHATWPFGSHRPGPSTLPPQLNPEIRNRGLFPTYIAFCQQIKNIRASKRNIKPGAYDLEL